MTADINTTNALPEPSPAPSPETQAPPPPTNNPPPFVPRLGLREITATLEMIIGSRRAIRVNEHWRGEDLEPMAMLLQMLGGMEGQYRAQKDKADADEKALRKKMVTELKEAGVPLNGPAT